MTFEPAQVKQN